MELPGAVRRMVLAAAVASAAVVLTLGPTAGRVRAAPEAKTHPLPFSDDKPPPPRLPVPLDRHLRGELVEFDGERVQIRWDWSAEEQLEDFERFVPVRKTLQGGFDWGDGHLTCGGTGGLQLRLGMVSDLTVKVDAKLTVPHDLGVVLANPETSDQSILCLVQDTLFTEFDSAAGNSNMINKMGSIAASAPGMVEFRYVVRSLKPKLARGDSVTFDVRRLGDTTTCVLTPNGNDQAAVTLKGKDPTPSFPRICPGLYVSGGAATFGPLEISGKLDPKWFPENDVLPHVASDLLHPGNRFKGAELKAAKAVEGFLSQPLDRPEDPKKQQAWVPSERLVGLVGKTSLALVIRIRAAEALMERGAQSDAVGDRVAQLLDAEDREARILAWQVLRPTLPWHFDYEPDADGDTRKEAADLVAAYLRERDYALAQRKTFVEGYWYTAARADAIRGVWDRAWDLRTPRVRVKTNLPRMWADWYVACLEAEYRALVRVVGREPAPETAPFNVFVFATSKDYDAFCKANGYEKRVGWGRFVDKGRNCCFVTFDKRKRPLWALNQTAKLFLKAATGRHWPTWFDEGRASWFGNGDYMTAHYDGNSGVLRTGLVGSGFVVRGLRDRAKRGKLWSTEDFLVKDPRNLEGDARRTWYVHAWALHHWLMSEAPEDFAQRFARWQAVMENQELSFSQVNEEGRRQFLFAFRGVLPDLDRRLAEWLKGL